MSPAPAYASRIAARLDRLPLSRTLWRMIFLISLGGALEFYDIFLSTYIAPGLVASSMFTRSAENLFSINGIGFFVCTLRDVLPHGIRFVADRFDGVRFYLVAGGIPFEPPSWRSRTAAGVDTWRFIASIEWAEQVTIDIPSGVTAQGARRAAAFYQFIAFCIVPVAACWDGCCAQEAVRWMDGAGWRYGAVGAWSHGGCAEDCRRAPGG
jgi:putative MFS transporter